MQSEKQVQTDIINYVKKQGGYVIKVIKGNSDGISDLIIGLDGLFIACEVKAEKYKADPEKQMSAWQHKHKNMVRSAGSLFTCCASLQQFEDFLDDNVHL